MPSATQPPSLTHHHSMSSSVNNQQPTSIAPNPSSGRPGIDRAHTFPTPPTSASGTITGMGSQQGSYDWTGSVPSGQAMGIEGHPHSTPATPATTPPGSALPSLPAYQNQQPLYSGQSASSAQYPSQHHGLTRSGSLQSSVYANKEMGPPSARISGSRPESEHGDVKLDPYSQAQSNEASHAAGDDEAEHEQDTDYTQSNNQTYGSHRGSYDTYNTSSNLASYSTEGTHISSDTTGTSNVNGGSGRGTPRTSQYLGTGYQTPPRAPPSSNLYNPTSDARGTLSNSSSSAENYTTGPYAPTQLNGVKRLREDDDFDTMKRRKLTDNASSSTIINGSFDSDNRPMNRARTTAAKTARAR